MTKLGGRGGFRRREGQNHGRRGKGNRIEDEEENEDEEEGARRQWSAGGRENGLKKTEKKQLRSAEVSVTYQVYRRSVAAGAGLVFSSAAASQNSKFLVFGDYFWNAFEQHEQYEHSD